MEIGILFIPLGIIFGLVTCCVLLTLHSRSENVKLLQKTAEGQNYYINYVPAALTPILFAILPGLGLLFLLVWLYHSSNSIWYIPAVTSIIAGCLMLIPYVYTKGKQVHWEILPTWLRLLVSNVWRIALASFLVVTVIYMHGKADLISYVFVGGATLVILVRLLVKGPRPLQEVSKNTAELARVQSVVKPLTFATTMYAVVRITILVVTVAWFLWYFVQPEAF